MPRIILIDPFSKTISERTEASDRRLSTLIVPEGCAFSTVRVDRMHILLLDDDGLLRGADQAYFRWRSYPQLLAGRAVMIATDERGETIDNVRTVEWVLERVTWPAAPFEVPEPSLVMQELSVADFETMIERIRGAESDRLAGEDEGLPPNRGRRRC